MCRVVAIDGRAALGFQAHAPSAKPWGKYSTPTILCHNIYLRPGPLAKKAVTQDENMSIGDLWKVGEYLDTEVLLTVVEEIRGG